MHEVDMAPTPEEFRHAIDRGETGGKVSFPDPAAAPLGTDEEAVGTPVSEIAVRTARDQEVQRAPEPNEGGSESSFRSSSVVLKGIAMALVLAAAIIFLKGRLFALAVVIRGHGAHREG